MTGTVIIVGKGEVQDGDQGRDLPRERGLIRGLKSCSAQHFQAITHRSLNEWKKSDVRSIPMILM